MEFNFDFRRLLLLVMLLGGFAWWGGFSSPEIRSDGFHSPPAVRKGWSYCVLLFVVGAVSVSLVEHTVGLMDPTNLRPAYVLLGVVLMVAGVIWLRTLKQTVGAPPSHQVAAATWDLQQGGMVTSPPP